MRRRILLYFTVVLMVLLASCALENSDRNLIVRIPDHPWETMDSLMWYTLKWTYRGQVQSLYVPQGEHIVNIPVSPGETVFVAAYPLGEMAPFGGVVTPLDQVPAELLLSQNDGYLVNLLLEADLAVTELLNYPRVTSDIKEKSDDFRLLDSVVFMRDLQNGELSEASIRIADYHQIEPFALPSGLWVSEYLRDGLIISIDNDSGALELPEGVFRYLNKELDRVLVLVVDAKGEFFMYMKQCLM